MLKEVTRRVSEGLDDAVTCSDPSLTLRDTNATHLSTGRVRTESSVVLVESGVLEKAWQDGMDLTLR